MANASNPEEGTITAIEPGDEIHVDSWPPLLSEDLFSSDDSCLPVYTETDTGSLTAWLDAHPDLATHLNLPLTRHPSTPIPTCPWDSVPGQGASRRALPTAGGYVSDPSVTATLESDQAQAQTRCLHVRDMQARIVASFFAAVGARNAEAVALLVARGLVSPDVRDATGRTPLIAAVEAGDNGTLVRLLAGLGAGVDTIGTSTSTSAGPSSGAAGGQSALRTPLMVAAARGRLPLVRLLVEELGADDGIVAPGDGQLALRLAAEAGHREVVDYLPARRGGAWRRGGPAGRRAASPPSSRCCCGACRGSSSGTCRSMWSSGRWRGCAGIAGRISTGLERGVRGR